MACPREGTIYHNEEDEELRSWFQVKALLSIIEMTDIFVQIVPCSPCFFHKDIMNPCAISSSPSPASTAAWKIDPCCNRMCANKGGSQTVNNP